MCIRIGLQDVVVEILGFLTGDDEANFILYKKPLAEANDTSNTAISWRNFSKATSDELLIAPENSFLYLVQVFSICNTQYVVVKRKT